MLARNGFIRCQNFLKVIAVQSIPCRDKITIDKTKVPQLQENDLEEHFISGSGPGGQKVNKMQSCVYLLHKPTGISVKVQESRDQGQNRKIARQRLTTLLDNHINKENSVENKKKLILQEKSKKRILKQKKLLEMKANWKELISGSELKE